MPNRILKESICTSPTIDALDGAAAEVFFYRLLVQCDDYGRFDGRPAILRARCFPLRLGEVTEAHIEAWLGELIGGGLVQTYEGEDGRPYLAVMNWDSHQRIRAKRARFPDPANGHHVAALSVIGGHVTSDDSESPTDADKVRPESESESESNPIAPRRRDEVFEAVERACGIARNDLTDTARGALNRAVGELKKVQATPAEIERRAKRWALPSKMTPMGLAKQWPTLAGPPEPEYYHPPDTPKLSQEEVRAAIQAGRA